MDVLVEVVSEVDVAVVVSAAVLSVELGDESVKVSSSSVGTCVTLVVEGAVS